MDSGAIEFGDAAGALAALKAGLEPGNELRVLWDGAEATGKKFGVKRIPVVKHQAHARLRPALRPGHRRHLRHHAHGCRSHGRLHHHRQHPERGRHRRPAQDRGPGRALEEPADRHGDARQPGPLHLRGLPRARHPRGVHRHPRDGRRRTPARSGTPTSSCSSAGKCSRWSACTTSGPASPPPTTGCPQFFYEDKLPPHNVVFTVSDEDLDSVFDFVDETAAQMGLDSRTGEQTPVPCSACSRHGGRSWLTP